MDSCVFVEFDVDGTDNVESAKDETVDVTKKYDIKTIPHIIVFEDKIVVKRISGPKRRDLEEIMKEKSLLRNN